MSSCQPLGLVHYYFIITEALDTLFLILYGDPI